MIVAKPAAAELHAADGLCNGVTVASLGFDAAAGGGDGAHGPQGPAMKHAVGKVLRAIRLMSLGRMRRRLSGLTPAGRKQEDRILGNGTGAVTGAAAEAQAAFLGRVLSSLPLMRGAYRMMQSFLSDDVARAKAPGLALPSTDAGSGGGPETVQSRVDLTLLSKLGAHTIHKVKVQTARTAWCVGVEPALAEVDRLRKQLADLQKQFEESRSEYLREVSALRDGVRVRGDPRSIVGQLSRSTDVTFFYDPMHSLRPHEVDFALQAVNEKLSMLVETNPEVVTTFDIGQVKALLELSKNHEVQKLMGCLKARAAEVLELQNDRRRLQRELAAATSAARAGLNSAIGAVMSRMEEDLHAARERNHESLLELQASGRRVTSLEAEKGGLAAALRDLRGEALVLEGERNENLQLRKGLELSTKPKEEMSHRLQQLEGRCELLGEANSALRNSLGHVQGRIFLQPGDRLSREEALAQLGRLADAHEEQVSRVRTLEAEKRRLQEALQRKERSAVLRLAESEGFQAETVEDMSEISSVVEDQPLNGTQDEAALEACASSASDAGFAIDALVAGKVIKQFSDGAPAASDGAGCPECRRRLTTERRRCLQRRVLGGGSSDEGEGSSAMAGGRTYDGSSMLAPQNSVYSNADDKQTDTAAGRIAQPFLRELRETLQSQERDEAKHADALTHALDVGDLHTSLGVSSSHVDVPRGVESLIGDSSLTGYALQIGSVGTVDACVQTGSVGERSGSHTPCDHGVALEEWMLAVQAPVETAAHLLCASSRGGGVEANARRGARAGSAAGAGDCMEDISIKASVAVSEIHCQLDFLGGELARTCEPSKASTAAVRRLNDAFSCICRFTTQLATSLKDAVEDNAQRQELNAAFFDEDRDAAGARQSRLSFEEDLRLQRSLIHLERVQRASDSELPRKVAASRPYSVLRRGLRLTIGQQVLHQHHDTHFAEKLHAGETKDAAFFSELLVIGCGPGHLPSRGASPPSRGVPTTPPPLCSGGVGATTPLGEALTDAAATGKRRQAEVSDGWSDGVANLEDPAAITTLSAPHSEWGLDLYGIAAPDPRQRTQSPSPSEGSRRPPRSCESTSHSPPRSRPSTSSGRGRLRSARGEQACWSNTVALPPVPSPMPMAIRSIAPPPSTAPTPAPSSTEPSRPRSRAETSTQHGESPAELQPARPLGAPGGFNRPRLRRTSLP